MLDRCLAEMGEIAQSLQTALQRDIKALAYPGGAACFSTQASLFKRVFDRSSTLIHAERPQYASIQEAQKSENWLKTSTEVQML